VKLKCFGWHCSRGIYVELMTWKGGVNQFCLNLISKYFTKGLLKLNPARVTANINALYFPSVTVIGDGSV